MVGLRQMGYTRPMESTATDRKLKLRVGCEFRYEVPTPTPAVFLVRPMGSGTHRINAEQWVTDPDRPYHDYVDLYGNVCRRTTLQPGWSVIKYEALVETVDALDPYDPSTPQLSVDELPDDVLVYTLPSRYCLSDQLSDRAWQLFGDSVPGWARAQAICDYVHRSLKFAYGTSNPTTSALDALTAGSGVCRDYAHLAISFCRAMNLPARYVFGYLPDIEVAPLDAPMDFAAWIEIFIGDRWWTFDPRNNERRKGRVLIARGRDALDVAMVTSYGAAVLHEMTVCAEPTGL
jgi:transglutaminase-like putative cysteine protease